MKEKIENEQVEEKRNLVLKKINSSLVVCEVFSGCRCSICGGFFEDGDDICGLGRHQIGQSYPKTA